MISRSGIAAVAALLAATLVTPLSAASGPAVPAVAAAAPSDEDRPLSSCRPANNLGDLGEGFPIHSQAVPARGSITAVALFIDFSDSPAPAGSLDEAVRNMMPGPAMLNQMSGGKMALSVRPHRAWVRMPKPLSQYPWSSSHSTLITDAIAAADPDVDFSGANVVFVSATRTATSISNSPTTNHLPITVDGTTIRNHITFGYDQWPGGWGPMVVAHEMGHVLGLPDLYLYNSPDAFSAIGGWDLMGIIRGHSPEFLAWHRWLLGWLPSNQVRCLPIGTSTARLVAGQWGFGATMAVVPLSATKMLVLESRRPIRYNPDQGDSGVLIYTIDSSVRGGYGPVQILHVPPGTSNNKRNAMLTEGSWTHAESGVTVTLTDSRGGRDLVQVTVPPA